MEATSLLMQAIQHASSICNEINSYLYGKNKVNSNFPNRDLPFLDPRDSACSVVVLRQMNLIRECLMQIDFRNESNKELYREATDKFHSIVAMMKQAAENGWTVNSRKYSFIRLSENCGQLRTLLSKLRVRAEKKGDVRTTSFRSEEGSLNKMRREIDKAAAIKERKRGVLAHKSGWSDDIWGEIKDILNKVETKQAKEAVEEAKELAADSDTEEEFLIKNKEDARTFATLKVLDSQRVGPSRMLSNSEVYGYMELPILMQGKISKSTRKFMESQYGVKPKRCFRIYNLMHLPVFGIKKKVLRDQELSETDLTEAYKLISEKTNYRVDFGGIMTLDMAASDLPDKAFFHLLDKGKLPANMKCSDNKKIERIRRTLEKFDPEYAVEWDRLCKSVDRFAVLGPPFEYKRHLYALLIPSKMLIGMRITSWEILTKKKKEQK